MTMLLLLGIAGTASAQDSMGLIIQTYDHLCTGAFLNSSAISYTVVPGEVQLSHRTDVCESCAMIMDFPPNEFGTSLIPALLERAEVFGIAEVATRHSLQYSWIIN